MQMLARPLNPFDPSHPISPAQFVGRAREIGELQAVLAHAKRGKPRHFLITGDRGAGKTSFFDHLRRSATSRQDGFNFIVIDFAIDRISTRLDLVRAIKAESEKLLDQHGGFEGAVAKLWGFVQRFEACGISYKPSESSPENHRDICRELAESLAKLVNTLCVDAVSGDLRYGYDGILLLIDEVDQSSDELDIGTFFKLLLERLNSKGCRQVVVGMAGLHSTPRTLVRSHPSSLRLFDELPLGDLSQDDVAELLAFAELQVRNEGFEGFCFSPQASERIIELSGGHAHFVHQFGYCAFEKACERPNEAVVVDEGHVLSGAFESRGALELIGDMYFQSPYEAVDGNPVALEALDFLCESPSMWVSAEELCANIQVGDLEIEDVLKELVGHSLLCRHKISGKYKVRHGCFAYWFKFNRPQFA